MPRPYDYVTFDCYGTLVDWRRGITEAFARAAGRAGVRVEGADVLAAHAEIEPIVQAGAYRSYRDVLTETARRVARRFDWELAERDARFLPESLAGWPAFADTPPALQRLVRAGYRLGLLSNVDLDLLAETLPGLGVEFALIVTAQDVASYKPAHAHFLRARREIGNRPWLHAAQSWYHDVVPARALGVPVAWVNRLGEARGDDAVPDREVRDLAALADWLAPEA